MKYIFFCILFIGAVLGNIFAQNNKSDNQAGGKQLYDLFSDDETNNLLIPKGKTAEDVIKNNLFVKSFVSKTTCYAGEPILVTFKLYTRLQSKSKVLVQPTFTGCTVIEQNTNSSPTDETVNHLKYKVYTVRQVQILPIKAGKVQISSAIIHNDIEFYPNKQALINGSASIHHIKTLSTTPFEINVSSLPNNQQINTEVVGSFRISADLSKKTDTVNDNNNLDIIIEGKGNFESVTLPNIQWPTSFEAFEPSTEDLLQTDSFPTQGKRIFHIPFVVKKIGNHQLPKLSFHFFNPATNSYEIVSTTPINLTIYAASNAYGVDESKIIQTPLSNYYLWLIPVIALFVIIGYYIFAPSSKKQVAKDGLKEVINKEILTEVTIEKNIVQQPFEFNTQLKNLEQLSDDAFYKHAIQLANQALEKEVISLEIANNINQICNSYLYGASAEDSKRTILDLFNSFNPNTN